jgi:hypothetical protein
MGPVFAGEILPLALHPKSVEGLPCRQVVEEKLAWEKLYVS